MDVPADSLKGKFKRLYDALPEGERQVFLDALGSPSVSAERLAWSLRQMDLPVSISPSLIRTLRRELRHEAARM